MSFASGFPGADWVRPIPLLTRPSSGDHRLPTLVPRPHQATQSSISSREWDNVVQRLSYRSSIQLRHAGSRRPPSSPIAAHRQAVARDQSPT